MDVWLNGIKIDCEVPFEQNIFFLFLSNMCINFVMFLGPIH